MSTIKTRFAPSPTGSLHIGGARTALFAYLIAKQNNGEFVVRIEDTDRARHDESAVARIVEDLKWLGLDWDEGIEVGGANGPYRQSERLDTYKPYIQQLLDDGNAYYAFETPEQLQQMRELAQSKGTGFKYPRPTVLPSQRDADTARAEGKPVVIRFCCPGAAVTVADEVFGDVTTPAEAMDDFVICKADGFPTYYLANVIDDTLMGITLVTRGQEFLGQTWRQLLLFDALNLPKPKYAHLPLIMDMKGRKLSKRDGDVDVMSFRKHGYLSETIVNFIALLGWNPGNDLEKFTLSELVDLFSIDRLGKANAKFDRDKLLAFSVRDLADASEDQLTEAFADFLSLNETPIPADDPKLLKHLLEINKGFRSFEDIIFKSGVLLSPDDSFSYTPKVVKKVLAKNDFAGYQTLTELRPLLAETDWTVESLEQLLNIFCQEKDLSMGKVAQPLRVAVTGTNVSPAIFDTLLLLGKDSTITRIDRCLAQKNEATEQ